MVQYSDTPERRKQRAVALAYQPDGDVAPRVIAKGEGLIAEEIIARAKQAGIYVHQSPELLSLLMRVDLDSYIPPDLYRVAAELLAWVYQLDSAKGHNLEYIPEIASAMPQMPEALAMSKTQQEKIKQNIANKLKEAEAVHEKIAEIKHEITNYDKLV